MDDRARSCRGASHTRRVSLSHSGPRIHVAQKSSLAGRRAGGGSHRRNLPPGLQAGTGDPWASSPAARWPGLDSAPQEAEGQIAPGSRPPSTIGPKPQPPVQSRHAACSSCGCSLPGGVWVLIFVLHLENYP